jgi:hypothetical protein
LVVGGGVADVVAVAAVPAGASGVSGLLAAVPAVGAGVVAVAVLAVTVDGCWAALTVVAGRAVPGVRGGTAETCTAAGSGPARRAMGQAVEAVAVPTA